MPLRLLFPQTRPAAYAGVAGRICLEQISGTGRTDSAEITAFFMNMLFHQKSKIKKKKKKTTTSQFSKVVVMMLEPEWKMPNVNSPGQLVTRRYKPSDDLSIRD